MKITKLGHCCLLIEERGKRILTDPGNYSTAQNELKEIDIILITHEHADHCHTESLKAVLKNNPQAKVITNNGVHELLRKHEIAPSSLTILTDGMEEAVEHILFEAMGKEHAEIYTSIKKVENTGYLVNERLFYPGDAFTVPGKQVEILALPVAGPWVKISEALQYAKTVKPRYAFPVHDGMIIPPSVGFLHSLPKQELAKDGIAFIPLRPGESYTF